MNNPLSSITRATPVVTLVYVAFYTFISLMTLILRYQTWQASLIEHPSLTMAEVMVPALQLVPSQMVLHIWVLFISTFVETTFLRFFFGLVILYFGTRFLEKSWNYSETLGTNTKIFSETLVYLSITGILTNLSSVLIKLCVDLITNDIEELTNPLNHGVWSIFMSFIVVLKQLIPEHNLKLFKGLIHIRLRQLPFIIIVTSISLSILLMSIEPIIPILNNFYISWCYLRYFQINSISDLLPVSESASTQSQSINNSISNNVIRGDASDTFAFIQFFPDFLHVALKPISKVVYHSAVFLKVIKKFNDDDIETGNLRNIKRINNVSGNSRYYINKDMRNSGNANSAGASNGNSTPTVSKEVSDRRIQVALKLLEQNETTKK